MSEHSDLLTTQLDTEILIAEVKRRPCLYAKDAPKYNDPMYRKLQWEEVAGTLFANFWSKCTAEDKAEKSEIVQRRWKNLRACFTRELKRQKDPKWIYGVAYKRRKYLYFNELSFLKSEFDKSIDEEVLHDIDLPEKTDADNTTVTIDTNIEESPIPEAVPIPKHHYQNNSQSQTSVEMNTPKSNESDSTNFALSLVPMLNMVPVEKRIDAHISILTVLKQFLKADDVINGNNNRLGSKRTYKKKDAAKLIPLQIKSEAESDDDVVIKYFGS